VNNPEEETFPKVAGLGKPPIVGAVLMEIALKKGS
jgi:hypothetical protein